MWIQGIQLLQSGFQNGPVIVQQQQVLMAQNDITSLGLPQQPVEPLIGIRLAGAGIIDVQILAVPIKSVRAQGNAHLFILVESGHQRSECESISIRRLNRALRHTDSTTSSGKMATNPEIEQMRKSVKNRSDPEHVPRLTER
jgi:hypothetical protein